MADREPSVFGDQVGRWLQWVIGYRWLVSAISVLAAVLCVSFAVHYLSINTDPVAMLDEELPFRQVQDRFRSEFPGLNQNLLLVIEAPTPEQAYVAARSLHQALAERRELFPHVFWPGASEFLSRNGLLLLPVDEVDALGDRLSQAQPLLAELSRNTNLAELFAMLELAQRQDRAAGSPYFARVHAVLAETLNAVADGAVKPMSWQRLMAGEAAANARELLLVEPVLDFQRVMAGRAAMVAIDDIRTELGLDGGDTRLRVTGNVALAHEELESSLTGAERAGLMALAVVVVFMGIGLRSARLVGIALASLFCGFALTLGFATLAVGEINLISIAFTVLYIGLGVNYAIHFLLRYREQLASGLSREAAISACGVRLWGALGLSALTTALGFLAFVPTAYTGVAELGLIASGAMVITLLVTYTFLPALLSIVPAPRNVPANAASVVPPALLETPLRYRWHIAFSVGIVAVAAALLGSRVTFDEDPLNLRDQRSESVSTLRSLLSEGASGYRNLQLLADGPRQARELAERLEALPQVERATSLHRFVPQDQALKLELLEEIRWMLGSRILQSDWRSPPTSAEKLNAAARSLQEALAADVSDPARSLRAALAKLRARMDAGQLDVAQDAHAAVVDPLAVTMRRLTAGLAADSPVTMDDIPQETRRQWVSRSGSWLVQIAPVDPWRKVTELDEFIAQVRSVDTYVTGTPVLQTESGRAVTVAFQQAVGWAVLGVFSVVLMVLRNWKDSTAVITPLLLGGLVTAGVMAISDVPFNFANVIAIPLLLGVGVDNGIHLVFRHRTGGLPGGNVLRTYTARAIVFGALTTALSFANLMLSPHDGTASMGFVLAVGLGLMVAATLIVLPTILGPARAADTHG